jgi:hypothetical protein
MNIKISSSDVAVDQEYFWQALHTCPANVKVQLLTQDGIALYGTYSKGWKTAFIAWAPLPKRPTWLITAPLNKD